MEKLAAIAPVRPVGDAEKAKTSLDQDTQGALLRFAKFVKDEKGKRERKPTPKGIHPAYIKQIQALDPNIEHPGQSLDITV
jgi:hypothetical protein